MLRIHGIPISVHTRKVIVAANEKGVAYRNEPVIPFTAPPEWAELSPTGKIPVVQAGDIVVRDSSIICQWLEREHPGHALYPSGREAWVKAL